MGEVFTLHLSFYQINFQQNIQYIQKMERGHAKEMMCSLTLGTASVCSLLLSLCLVGHLTLSVQSRVLWCSVCQFLLSVCVSVCVSLTLYSRCNATRGSALNRSRVKGSTLSNFNKTVWWHLNRFINILNETNKCIMGILKLKKTKQIWDVYLAIHGNCRPETDRSSEESDHWSMCQEG